MTFKPAHKHIGDAGNPGQIINDVTLGDYIARKTRYEALNAIALEKEAAASKTKLTFEEWWDEVVFDGNTRGYHWGHIPRESLHLVWKAAQENK